MSKKVKFSENREMAAKQVNCMAWQEVRDLQDVLKFDDNDYEATVQAFMGKEVEIGEVSYDRMKRNKLIPSDYPKGMSVSIFHNPLGDCTNNGVTKNKTRAILIGEGIPEIFEADEETPVLVVVRRIIGGQMYIHCEPIEPVRSGNVGYMSGGNFVYTTDSRYSSNVCQYPIAVHDRQETQRQYEQLSRETKERNRMGSYLNLKKKHQDELDEFPMVFAFNEKQFDEAMGKLGLTANDTDKIYSIGGGGFIRKIDSDKLSEMFERHSKEMEEGMKDPQFVYEAFSYELSNHEFIVTGDSTDALESLGITPEEVGKNQMWLGQLKKAVAEQYKYYENRN